MENSEVLNQDTSVPKDGAIQQDVEPIQSAPQVLEQNTNMYTSAKSAPVPVGEKDHASEIAGNMYDYNSEAEKDYNEKVSSITTQSTGKMPITAEWEAKYGMDDEYKVNDSDDYSWNKRAGEMAQLVYDQQAAQHRADSLAAKQELNQAATNAWNEYFGAKYSAKQTQDKMGWSGGQEQASDRQIAFLQAESAANMYTQEELQKYGVQSKLSIARMYAAAEQNKLALQYYQEEMNIATEEANRTGWYVSPEAKEMFIQQDAANKVIADASATPEAKARAKQVIDSCNAFYDKLGFERGYAYETDGEGNYVLDERGNKKVVSEYYGVKLLATRQHELEMRNNEINQELQREANRIAGEANTIGWANVRAVEAQTNATIAMQNNLKGKEAFEKGSLTSSGHPDNYYEVTTYVKDKNGVTKIDKNGNPITETKTYNVNDATNLVKHTDGKNQMAYHDGAWFVMDNDGNYYRVYNSNQEHADKYAADKKKTTNYKPKVNN